MNPILKKLAIASLMLMCSTLTFFAQIINQTISLNAVQTHIFQIESTNMGLNPVGASPGNASYVYYYPGGPGGNFIANYHRYKYTHPGITNNDIVSVTCGFNYKIHCDINHPTQPYWWSPSQLFVIIPQNACNSSYWSSYTVNDCVNAKNCIMGGNVFGTPTLYGSCNDPAANFQYTFTSSSPTPLSSLLLNQTDFSIAYAPNGNTNGYIDITSPLTVQLVYKTYPIANNTISGDQSFTISGDPSLFNATAPTGGNKGIFTYQWQSSLNNTTWTNITGATGATYNAPTVTQTTYYRRIVYSPPQSPSTSNVVTVTINPPATPIGITVNPQSTTSLLVAWNTSPGATSYKIYDCSTNALVATVNAPNTSHIVTGLSPATTYQYKITAIAGSLTSPVSSCVSGTTYANVNNNTICCDQVNPGAVPSSLITGNLPSGGNGSYTYMWQTSSDAVTWTNIGVTTQNYTPPVLTSTTHYRRVASSAGNSNNSNMVTVTVDPPPTPTGINITTQSTTALLIAWNITSGATGYKIYDCSNNSLVATINVPTISSYLITGLNPATTYQYKLVAECGALASPFSACVAGTTYANIGNNTICCDETHTGLATTSMLTGSIPTGGDGTYTYLWEYSTDGINWTSTGIVTINYTPPPVVNTTYYRRKVTSISLTHISNIVTITVDPPPTPTGVNLTALSTTEIQISWNASSGATIYNIYDCATNALVATVNAPNTTYIINNLNPFTYYQFNIVAVCGSNQSAPSTCVGETTLDTQLQISTFAGNGSNIYNGNGGPALSAGIPLTNAISKDMNGNIYLLHASAGSYLIRKINSSGTISVFAGNGTNGYSGDNGPATSAAIYPSGMTQDASGNFYVTDAMHHVIRKITPAGIITTIAGNGTAGYSGDNGPATSALINRPADITCDINGNIYYVDRWRIRKISTSGIITTVAGNGIMGNNGNNGPATSAQIRPTNLAIDAAGNIFFTDHTSNVIRKVSTSGIISLYAGTGVAGYSGDYGNCVSAKLNGPIGLTFDNTGNLYVADRGNQVIRKINNAGIIKTVAGSAIAGFSGDGGLSTSATFYNPYYLCSVSSNIYIFDFVNNRVRIAYSECYKSAPPNVTNQKDCCGSSCSSVQLGSTALAGLSYAWSPSIGLDCNTCAQPNASPCNVGSTTSYMLTVSGPYCTTSQTMVSVFTNSPGYSCCRIRQVDADTTDTEEDSDELILYPNPTTSQVSVVSRENMSSISIVDLSGHAVFEQKDVNHYKLNLDLSSYNKGIYFIIVKENDKTIRKKLIVQ